MCTGCWVARLKRSWPVSLLASTQAMPKLIFFSALDAAHEIRDAVLMV